METITIKEYLNKKGITYKECGKELISHCVFNNCDKDSKGSEGHLYFNSETSQYDCKKCGEKGNIITLSKFLGDNIQSIALNPITTKSQQNKKHFNAQLVEDCHQALPNHIRQYLNNRGVIDSVIDEYKLGWGDFYNQFWITIPIKDIYGNYRYFKLRQDPNMGERKSTYPASTKNSPIEAQIYGWDMLDKESIIICEGELDRLALLSKNIDAVTTTHGAMTFKEEWVEKFKAIKKIHICYDNDNTGKNGAEKVAKMLKNDNNEISIITLPEEVGEGGDVTDYLTKFKGDPNDLFIKYAKPYPEKIDISQFKPLSVEELTKTLGLTIKQDETNKVITFLCELSAYTENAQFNISYNAPSSTGKSYIPTEGAKLFPEEDVVEVAYCSPTAFFHDVGQYDKEKNTYLVDLSQKILIFLDQPHMQLLERLRPLLSHDKKEIMLKITDKNQVSGLKTKNILIRGYPAVIFCTAGLNIDDQEATRFLLLSPEMNQEKIREGIYESIKKESNSEAYKTWLEENPDRKLLKERIRAIKLEGIKEINIPNYEKIVERFLAKNEILKPRHQRDIKRLVSLIKSFALVNLWWRDKNGATIIANQEDIEQAFKIWDNISVSQELKLPPFIYKIYQDIILIAWKEKNGTTGQAGLTRQEILSKYFTVYGKIMDTNQLRQQILPMLETAGLIIQEPDPSDARKILVFPANQNLSTENNSETQGGVKNNEDESENNDGVSGRSDTS